jgi:hypothetical protein
VATYKNTLKNLLGVGFMLIEFVKVSGNKTKEILCEHLNICFVDAMRVFIKYGRGMTFSI